MEKIKECIETVWEQEQDILNVVHKVCTEHNLKYSLIFGTLLGAVRHGGFIPWDDDIDIMMPREDYEKLLSIWDNVAPQGYLLQNKRTDFDFTQNFTKIRKNNTTFIQDEVEKTKKYHTGIFVDIFPADRVAPKGLRRSFQYVASALNLLCARGYSSGRTGLIGFVEKCILKMSLEKQLSLYHKTEKIISKWSGESCLEWYSPNTIEVSKRYFDSNMFDSMDKIKFNGLEYCCIKETDKVLTRIYGDYMKLPPEEKRRWAHHPIIVDFENNYTELVKRNGGQNV